MDALTFTATCWACGGALNPGESTTDGRKAAILVACCDCAATYLVQVQLHAVSPPTSRPAATLPADDPRHGTQNGYGNHRCRCAACRAEHTACRQRERKGAA